MTETVCLDGGLSPAEVERVARHFAVVEISTAAEERVEQARAVVDRMLAEDRPIYGLNTGLGAAVDTRLSADDVVAYQQRAVPARAVGVGGAAGRDVVRATMLVRAAGLAAGGSGASLGVLRSLIAALNAGVHPVVPLLGSVGAGDLPPLAHLALGLCGQGQAEYHGEVLPAGEALARAGLAPLVLAAKDGHALMGANAFSVGRACLALVDLGRLLRWLEAAAAMGFEAARGNLSVLDGRALAARPAFGQLRAAARLRRLLDGSALWLPDAARRVQDPLSLRCVPQAFGALLHALDGANEAVAIELASCGDNPVVIAADGVTLSQGNFDLTALVLELERLGQAIAHVACGSAWRTLKLMSPGFSGLPRFLTPLGPSRNGFSTAQKTLAALEAEIRHLALPASLASLPVADGVEDQASLAPGVVTKLCTMIDRLRWVVTIELVVAAQGVELRGLPHIGAGASAAHLFVREHVAPLKEDRAYGADFAALATAIAATDPATLFGVADA